MLKKYIQKYEIHAHSLQLHELPFHELIKFSIGWMMFEVVHLEPKNLKDRSPYLVILTDDTSANLLYLLE